MNSSTFGIRSFHVKGLGKSDKGTNLPRLLEELLHAAKLNGKNAERAIQMSLHYALKLLSHMHRLVNRCLRTRVSMLVGAERCYTVQILELIMNLAYVIGHSLFFQHVGHKHSLFMNTSNKFDPVHS